MGERLLVLVLGLVGGVGGALATTWFAGRPTGGAPPGAAVPRPDADLAARVERLEARLDAGARPLLEGRAAAGTGGPERPATLSPPEEERLVERLSPRVEEIVARKVEALEKQRAAEEEAAAKALERRTVTLAEAASEIGLTTREEAALRQIYADYEQGMLKIVAGEDGDLEEIERDIAQAKDDESVRPKLMQKYLPRLLPRLGDFMALEMEKNTRIEEALGEKARRLDEFDIQESHAFGLDGGMTVQARAER